jgi:hypothetical protein
MRLGALLDYDGVLGNVQAGVDALQGSAENGDHPGPFVMQLVALIELEEIDDDFAAPALVAGLGGGHRGRGDEPHQIFGIVVEGADGVAKIGLLPLQFVDGGFRRAGRAGHREVVRFQRRIADFAGRGVVLQVVGEPEISGGRRIAHGTLIGDFPTRGRPGLSGGFRPEVLEVVFDPAIIDGLELPLAKDAFLLLNLDEDRL